MALLAFGPLDRATSSRFASSMTPHHHGKTDPPQLWLAILKVASDALAIQATSVCRSRGMGLEWPASLDFGRGCVGREMVVIGNTD